MLELEHLFTIDKWVQAYIILKLIDFITGFIKAYKVTGFKSAKLRNGIANTVLELVLIVFSEILGQLLGIDILVLATKMLFVFKECISIIENAGVCGVNLPNIIKDKIQDLNPDKESGENGNV